MSDQNVANQAPNPLPPHRRGRIRRAFWLAALVVAAGFAGAYANSALSQGPGFGHGFGSGRWHHQGGFMAPFDPARAEDRADRMIRHLAIEVDATNEQQDKLRAVARATVRDLVPMREKAQAARGKAREMLTRDTVDRSEVERFRAEQVALAEAFSKRVAQAVSDAAEILTAEQRRKLNDHFPPMGERFGPPWRRW
jgi:Spy/CpxP family protein refolding chaperone